MNTVQEKMLAAGANVLTETGLMLKTCQHGVRHPVGHVTDAYFDATREDALKQHERFMGRGHLPTPCDGCCEAGAAAIEAARVLAEAQSATK